MRRFIVGITGSLFLMFLMATCCAAQASRTFTGEIVDENLNCVQTPMRVPDEFKIKTKEECVLYWTYWKGTRYVLYDAANKTTYQLDPQDKVIPFIAGKVLITGTESNKAIKIAEIKADENGAKSKGQS